MSSYEFNGNRGYGNYGGLANMWGFGDDDDKPKRRKARPKGRAKGRPKGRPRLRQLLRRLAKGKPLKFKPKPGKPGKPGKPKGKPKGKPIMDKPLPPPPPTTLAPAAQPSDSVTPLDIAPAAAQQDVMQPGFIAMPDTGLQIAAPAEMADPTASTAETIAAPAQQGIVAPVGLPVTRPVMMMPGAVPMQRQMARPRMPIGPITPIVPPRITPQQARLGAMTAALASALLLF